MSDRKLISSGSPFEKAHGCGSFPHCQQVGDRPRRKDEIDGVSLAGDLKGDCDITTACIVDRRRCGQGANDCEDTPDLRGARDKRPPNFSLDSM